MTITRRCSRCARFLRRTDDELCVRCTGAAPAAAGPVADLWSPSAAWLVPTAADKARVRAAVEAADRELALEHAEWSELAAAAKRRVVPTVALSDAEWRSMSKSSWQQRLGAALCLAPAVAFGGWLAHVVHWL